MRRPQSQNEQHGEAMDRQAIEPSHVLTVDQLARRWNVNVKTIYASIQEGRIPVLRLGRVIRVSNAVVRSIEQASVVPERK